MTTNSKAFTLIELLIVIGILSVLVVTILITLNPSEAQKKTRDTKRMKDVATLQAILEQYIGAGNPPVCESTGNFGGKCDSTQGNPPSGTQSQPCAASWILLNNNSQADLCNYTKTVPLDPSNGANRTFITGKDANGVVTVSTPGPMYYQIKMSGSDYEINVRQESKTNIGNTMGDGGNDDGWAETGSRINLL